jgi:hypothetical protein
MLLPLNYKALRVLGISRRSLRTSIGLLSSSIVLKIGICISISIIDSSFEVDWGVNRVYTGISLIFEAG